MIISTREVTSTQRKQIPGTSSRIGNLSNNISPKFKTLRFLLSLEKLKPHSRALPPGFKIRSRFQLSTLPTVTRPKSPENRKTRLFSPHPRPARKRRLSFFGSPPAQSSQGGQSSRLVCAQHQTSTTRARAPPSPPRKRHTKQGTLATRHSFRGRRRHTQKVRRSKGPRNNPHLPIVRSRRRRGWSTSVARPAPPAGKESNPTSSLLDDAARPSLPRKEERILDGRPSTSRVRATLNSRSRSRPPRQPPPPPPIQQRHRLTLSLSLTTQHQPAKQTTTTTRRWTTT